MNAETIGRYRIEKELGRGAVGRVLLAHDPEIDRPVAIKTVQIFAALPDGERREARERFLREARAAGRLSHPGIVTVFDVGEQHGVPYLAMEYLRGDSLDAFCRPGTLLPAAVAVELIARAAEALDYAHREGIVHRDIKPANLMRVGDTDVKIMDFGLATGATTQLTQDGTLHGTPSYMSPEQIRGETLDGRTDLFSLGCVLYEMLTGEKAFAGDSVSSVIYRVVHERPGGVEGIADRVPAALVAVLESALAKDRADRPASGSDLARALRAAKAQLPASGSGPTAAIGAPPPDARDLPPAHGRRKHSGSWMVVGMVAVMAAIAIAAFVYTRRVRESGPVEFGEPAAAASEAAGSEPSSSLEPAAVGGPTLRARVRTEPAGLAVTLDGAPFAGDEVEFPAGGPFPILLATQACRTVEHLVSTADAGGEIVLVPDPVEVEVAVAANAPGATVSLNGAEAGEAPATLRLDLCVDNRVRVEAPRFRPTEVVVAAGARPLEARSALASVVLEAIPLGFVIVPKTPVPVTVLIDDERVAVDGGRAEIEEGGHRLRVISREHWIDVSVRFELRGGETVTPLANLPGLAEIGVQSFPPNARVSLRREGEDWRFLDTTPTSRRIAPGRYRVRVESPSGAVEERDVELVEGANPPVRVSFAGGKG